MDDPCRSFLLISPAHVIDGLHWQPSASEAIHEPTRARRFFGSRGVVEVVNQATLGSSEPGEIAAGASAEAGFHLSKCFLSVPEVFFTMERPSVQSGVGAGEISAGGVKPGGSGKVSRGSWEGGWSRLRAKKLGLQFSSFLGEILKKGEEGSSQLHKKAKYQNNDLFMVRGHSGQGLEEKERIIYFGSLRLPFARLRVKGPASFLSGTCCSSFVGMLRSRTKYASFLP